MHLRALHRPPHLLHLRLTQPHLQRPQILLQIPHLLRPRNRNHIPPLRQQPRERQLARRAALALRNLPQLVHELQITGEVLGREARGEAAEVAVFKVVGGAVRARQEAAAERRVGDDGDAELAAGGEQGDGGKLDVEAEGRVFDLYGGDGVDGVGAAEGGRGAFGEAEVFDFAFAAGPGSSVALSFNDPRSRSGKVCQRRPGEGEQEKRGKQRTPSTQP